ncbi:MAG: hypothetical protein ACI86X_002073, partial [Moritella sp.]
MALFLRPDLILPLVESVREMILNVNSAVINKLKFTDNDGNT